MAASHHQVLYCHSSRGSSSQPIWLDRTFCNTAQPCIASCRSCPSPVDDAVCSHNLDAIVVCCESIFSHIDDLLISRKLE